MLKIRLRRIGARKRPSYQIVVMEARSARDGAYVEKVGYYDPKTKPETVKFDEDKVRQWLKNGAQPTDAVARFLWRAGLIEKPVFVDKPPQPKEAKKEAGAEAAKPPEALKA